MSEKFSLKKDKVYSLDSYDKFFCLKPSWSLVMAMVFLCRDFILSILLAATALGGGASNVPDMLVTDRHWTRFVAEAPALILLVALSAKLPTANGAIRWIWKHGRLFLIVASTAQFLLIVKVDDLWKTLDNLSLLSALVVALELGIFAYVLLSKRIRDTFADFPARLDADKREESRT